MTAEGAEREGVAHVSVLRAGRLSEDEPTTTTHRGAPGDGRPGSEPLTGAQLAVLLTGAFMAQFDFFVVNVAAPSIRRSLSATTGQLELIVGMYAFGYASGLVLGGRLGDRYGHRRLFVCGMLAFGFASACCGAAREPEALILARLLQGATAAAMLPQVLAVVSARTRGARRARAMAWYGVAGGVGSLAGQVLGGFLVSADVDGLGWRLIFLVNLPVGALGALAALWVLDPPCAPPGTRPTLDVAGAGVLAVSIGLVLVPLTLGRDDGWPPWTWICIGSAVPLLAATVGWEWRLERRARHPLLPVHLFATPSFRIGMLAAAAFMAFFASYMFALALLLQAGYGLDSFHAGLAFGPSGLTFLVAALLTPRLSGRIGRHAFVGGALTVAVALIVLAIVAHADAGHAWLVAVVPTAALASLGNGAVYPSLLGMALAHVAAGDAGAASGALATAQQFAASAGVAVMGTVFFAAARHPVSAGAGNGMAWVAVIGAALMALIAAIGVRLRDLQEPGRS
ncbi:MAG TPA: MFS transporter [Marmoricola sp.]|nr:MFS transporter [Marmoricola sp.]